MALKCDLTNIQVKQVSQSYKFYEICSVLTNKNI